MLHVDDQLLVRRMVKKALEQDEPSALFPPDSGKAALEILREKCEEAKEKGLELTDLVNVVISDVEMPVMDGYTLCRSIKDDPALSHLPVYLFSIADHEETQHKGESVKADGQFPSPRPR